MEEAPPGGTQEAPGSARRHPGGTQEAPGDTQEAPRRHPGGTQEAPGGHGHLGSKMCQNHCVFSAKVVGASTFACTGAT